LIGPGRATVWSAITLAVLAGACASGPAAPPTPELPPASVAIRGGLIVDGSGRPAYVGDVLVRGDSVLYAGPSRPRGADEPTAALEIDARGRIVTPGFVAFSADDTSYGSPADGVALRVLVDSAGGARAAADRNRPLDGSTHVLAMVDAVALQRQEVGMRDELPSASQLARMEDAVSQAIAAGAAGLVLRRWPSSPSARDAAARAEQLRTRATLAAAAQVAGGVVLLELGATPGRPFDDLADGLAVAARGSGATLLADIGRALRDAPDAVAPMLAQVDSARTAGLDVWASLAFVAQREIAAAYEAPWLLVAGNPGTFLRAAQQRDVPLTFEAAVARVTSVPARWLGVPSRHCVRAGCAADLVVLDSASLAARVALLDGVPTWLDGARTTARPGRIIRRGPVRSLRPPS
jgi:hypothetical protein